MAVEATKAQLVDQIKYIQRCGSDPKQAWWDYCDQHLGGVRDPSRHGPTNLSGFLAFYHSGAVSASANNGVASKGGAGKGGAGQGGAGKGSSAKSGEGAGGWDGYSRSPWVEAPAAPSAAWGEQSGFSRAASDSTSGAGKGSSAKSDGGAGCWDRYSRSPWVEAPAAPAATWGEKGGYIGAASASASNGSAGKGGAGKGRSAKSGGGAGDWDGYSLSPWVEAPAAPSAAWGEEGGYIGTASASASKGGVGKSGAGKGGAGKGSSAKSGGGAGGWDGYSRSPWVEAPAAPAAAWGDKGGFGAVDGGAVGPSLRDIVKAGQRASGHWRNAWQTYCAQYGNGVNDPARHDDAHITGFIDYVGQVAFTSLQSVAGEKCPSTEPQSVPLGGQPSAGGPAAWAAAAQPPVKRPPVGSAARVGTKATLVDKIKALQKSDPAAKEAWWSHCDDKSKGTKDPDLHGTASLEAFLATYSVA